MLEIAEAVAVAPLPRSVLFAPWTAEDVGQGALGSQHFVQTPPFPLDELKIYLNLDMIGRSSLENEETRAHRVVAFEKTIGGVENLVEAVNRRTVRWPLSYGLDGTSDHASFYKKGIPALSI